VKKYQSRCATACQRPQNIGIPQFPTPPNQPLNLADLDKIERINEQLLKAMEELSGNAVAARLLPAQRRLPIGGTQQHQSPVGRCGQPEFKVEKPDANTVEQLDLPRTRAWS
jgi:hypothetical protein